MLTDEYKLRSEPKIKLKRMGAIYMCAFIKTRVILTIYFFPNENFRRLELASVFIRLCVCNKTLISHPTSHTLDHQMSIPNVQLNRED